MTTQRPEYTPDTLTPWDQRLMRIVCGRQISSRVELGFQTGRLEIFFTPGKTIPAKEKFDISLTWGDSHLGVAFGEENGLYALLGTGADQSPVFGMELDALPKQVFWAFVEAVFEPVRNWLSTALGEAAELVEPLEIPRTGTVLDFRFLSEESIPSRVTGSIFLPHDEKLFAVLESRTASFPPLLLPMETVEEMAVEASFGLGCMSLPVGDIKGLSQGDILIPDRWFFSQNEGLLIILPFSYRFTYNDETNDILLIEKGVKRVDAAMENSVGDIEDLEIKVVFEIERRMMPLKEVRTLVKDSLIPIGTKPADGVVVDIIAGDKCIGKGKIVGLGETLGIQIIEQGGLPGGATGDDTLEHQ